MPLDIARLRREFQGESFFTQWIYREEVDSTMDLARELAELGAPEGTVVIAERQTEGRGRRGRGWESPVGGAWFSLLLRPSIELCRSGCISVLLAVAIARALRERYGIPVSVKWPNDLLLNHRKLGGILIELSTVGERIEWLVAGVGINVNNPVPGEARIPSISLSGALARPVELEEFFVIALRAIAQSYSTFLSEGFEPIRQDWTGLSAVCDGIWVHKGEERFEAHARGLSDLGKLIVERAGRIEELVAEEVTLSLKE
ncbi:MAG: biotin--[acetyl-CoA-carboxylase] ligase [Candidatus Fraserbacteria bacterium RBG_16_55_9]|uniref:Biotin--[acetyl-CoA-carboxylase] ligase n=1 Tax=Fraserbacteria sp. (strain RBG_16_55_9) TaxID=1817864 RepID=A0A1F5V379_FRAXR|nr:MAG: biotin--[acetyl-CoA-carboxylase] ligase [Candidatus Fraserbacteria bacterium RBG_16_55_9]